MDNYTVSRFCSASPIKSERICNERPFFLNANGDIAFRIPTYVFIKVVDSASRTLVAEYIDFLNKAFKFGYETKDITSFSDIK